MRDVASVASVVGRSFGMPLLERLVAPDRLRPALSELQRLDLVVEERRRPTPEYRFRHGLVREAAYTSLLEERRRELHRVVGTTLEELEPGELSEAYGLLAHHFTEADDPERAARYLLAAGSAARNLYADEEAIAHYRRALAFLDRLGDSERARAALFEVALTHHVAYDFEAANAAWAKAFTRPEQPAVRLEPTERLETGFTRMLSWAPGHGYDVFAWMLGPNLFRGLLPLERGLSVVPDLAEHMSVSKDGCAYVFRLREGLRWGDGEPLRASDFVFTYAAMQEQATETAHFLEDVEAYAADDVTLELRMPEPRAYVLYLIAQLPFFPWPKHLVESLGPEWHQAPSLIGNGPYLVEQDDERAVLNANPFWGGSRGNVGEVTIEVIDSEPAYHRWREGRYDFLLQPFIPSLDGLRDTAILLVPLNTLTFVAFGGAPPFDDVRVRKARITEEKRKDNTLWAWGWSADYPEPQGMLDTFLTRNPLPIDDELSALRERARSLRSRDDRLELYREIDRRLVAEDVWVVPTVYEKWHVLHRPYVNGIWTHPLGIGTFDGVVVSRPG